MTEATCDTRYVWLASYPKSGNTWFRCLLWALDHPDRPTVDLGGLPGRPLPSDRQLFDGASGLDSRTLTPEQIDGLRPQVDRSLLHHPPLEDVAAGIWVRKVHDAFSATAGGGPLFPADTAADTVYLVRDPLDVCVSYAHHQGGADLDKVIDQMVDPDDALSGEMDRLPPQLRQRLGGWSAHVASWLDQDTLPVTVVRYEDLHVADLAVLAPAVARCGRRADAAAICDALERCRFGRVAEIEARDGFLEGPPGIDRFFRAGRVGDGRQVLRPDQIQRLVDHHGPMMTRLGYL